MIPINERTEDFIMDGISTSLPEERHQNSLNDDIFGEEDPSSTGGIQRQHNTEGYREGVSSGKTEFMQEGFDEGYTIGARFALRVGWVRGTCSALAKVGKVMDEEKGSTELEERFKDLKKKAEEELDVNKVFSTDYFDEKGIWKYPVKGVDDEDTEEFTFDEVIESHPLISKWTALVVEETKKIGLELDVPSRS